MRRAEGHLGKLIMVAALDNIVKTFRSLITETGLRLIAHIFNTDSCNLFQDPQHNAFELRYKLQTAKHLLGVRASSMNTYLSRRMYLLPWSIWATDRQADIDAV